MTTDAEKIARKRETTRLWKLKNKERVKQKDSEYKAARKESIKKYNSEYYKNNLVKFRVKSAKWRAANKETIKARRNKLRERIRSVFLHKTGPAFFTKRAIAKRKALYAERKVIREIKKRQREEEKNGIFE